MSRLFTINPTDATGHSAEIFRALKQTAGMIPNCYLTIGTHSPNGLAAALNLDEVVECSTLTKSEIQAVRLVVSTNSGCNYGITAHAFLAKFSGLSTSAVKAIKAEHETGIPKLDALLTFVRHLVSSKGLVKADILDAALQAGYSEQNIIEVMLAIASTTFIDLVNRVNDTKLDYPQTD
ncbi:carboxymuconolactone decarboxylase family protein [Pseudomonas sp. RC10]|uniref:carboxymuconolactone decarboxylase family protein n=1 Tax=Pseudomonas bambusae TaxID=3139142 RepID=UPI003138DD27